jgi:hypothetical protein
VPSTRVHPVAFKWTIPLSQVADQSSRVTLDVRGSVQGPVTTELVTSSGHRCASTLWAKWRACSLPAVSCSGPATGLPHAWRCSYQPSAFPAPLPFRPLCLWGPSDTPRYLCLASRADHTPTVEMRNAEDREERLSPRSVINCLRGTVELRCGRSRIPQVWFMLCVYRESRMLP